MLTVIDWEENQEAGILTKDLNSSPYVTSYNKSCISLNDQKDGVI